MRSLVTLVFSTFAAIGAPVTWLVVWNELSAAWPPAFRLPEAVVVGAVLGTPFAALLGTLGARGVPALRRQALVSAWAGAIWALPVIWVAGALLINGGMAG